MAAQAGSRGQPVLAIRSGQMTFDRHHRRTVAGGETYAVSEVHLRRALDGRLPTRRTVTAFAHGADAEEKRAVALWEAAEYATCPPTTVPAALCVPGVFTWGGLVRAALARMRAGAGNPYLRNLAGAPEADGRVPRSTLRLILAGRREQTR